MELEQHTQQRRARWTRVREVWAVNLDGSDATEWRPPRIEVFEVAAERWAYAFIPTDRELRMGGGTLRSAEQARRAAAAEAISYFGAEHRAALAELATAED